MKKPFGWMTPMARGLYFLALILMGFFLFGHYLYPKWADWRKLQSLNAALEQGKSQPVRQISRTLQGNGQAQENQYRVTLALKPTFRDALQLLGDPAPVLSLQDTGREMRVMILTLDEGEFARKSLAPCTTILQEQKQFQRYLLIGRQFDEIGYGESERCAPEEGKFVVLLNQRFPIVGGVIVSCSASAPAGTPQQEELLSEILAVCQSIRVKPV